MAKYTKKEIQLLETIAKLRGLVYRAVHAEAGLDAVASLNTPEYGAGLPHYEDLHAGTPRSGGLAVRSGVGYKASMNSRKLYYTPMGYESDSAMHMTALHDSVESEEEARKLFEADERISDVEIHTRPLKKGKKSWQCQGLLSTRHGEQIAVDQPV